MLAGVIVGLLVNDEFGVGGSAGIFLERFIQPLFDPIGRIFITLLKMLIVPLILASMVLGVARVGDIRKLGGLGSA
jgi:proton glutamate symport protein